MKILYTYLSIELNIINCNKKITTMEKINYMIISSDLILIYYPMGTI